MPFILIRTLYHCSLVPVSIHAGHPIVTLYIRPVKNRKRHNSLQDLQGWTALTAQKTKSTDHQFWVRDLQWVIPPQVWKQNEAHQKIRCNVCKLITLQTDDGHKDSQSGMPQNRPSSCCSMFRWCEKHVVKRKLAWWVQQVQNVHAIFLQSQSGILEQRRPLDKYHVMHKLPGLCWGGSLRWRLLDRVSSFKLYLGWGKGHQIIVSGTSKFKS